MEMLGTFFGDEIDIRTFDRLCTYFNCRIEKLVEHIPDVKVTGTNSQN